MGERLQGRGGPETTGRPEPERGPGDALGRTAYAEVTSARYDADFAAIYGGPDRGDLAFFVAAARAAGGPICEVGAGTGRVVIPILEAVPEAVVTAVEPSASMRARMVDKFASRGDLAAGATVVDGHFGEIPAPIGSQALVYSAFRSFQHVLTAEGQLAGLREVARVLRPGGALAMDLFDPDYASLEDAQASLVARDARDDGRVVERWDAREVDRVGQTVSVHFHWIVRDRDGGFVEEERGSYAVRYTFPWELRHLLARAGFDRVEIAGDYEGTPLGPEPAELVVRARAPG